MWTSHGCGVIACCIASSLGRCSACCTCQTVSALDVAPSTLRCVMLPISCQAVYSDATRVISRAAAADRRQPIQVRTAATTSSAAAVSADSCHVGLMCGTAETLEVLPRVRDRIDGPTGLRALRAGDEGADVDDALALLAGDAGPVVGVRRVGQVLVLLELVDAGRHEVRQAQPLAAVLEEVLDGHLLGAGDDVLDHGA